MQNRHLAADARAMRLRRLGFVTLVVTGNFFVARLSLD